VDSRLLNTSTNNVEFSPSHIRFVTRFGSIDTGRVVSIKPWATDDGEMVREPIDAKAKVKQRS